LLTFFFFYKLELSPFSLTSIALDLAAAVNVENSLPAEEVSGIFAFSTLAVVGGRITHFRHQLH
jgi:hypothetical protein